MKGDWPSADEGSREATGHAPGRTVSDLLRAIRRRLLIRTRLKSALHWTHINRWGYDLARNWVTDLRYGGNCGGKIMTPYSHLGAYNTRSVHYRELERVFHPAVLPIGDCDILVDVGCGKGRVINFWVGRWAKNRVVGLELDAEIAEWARDRLRPYPNVEIITGDAVANLPPEGSVFWLYNPFQDSVLRRFRDRLKEIKAGGADCRVLYYNCRHLEVFEEDPEWTIELLDLGLIEPCVLIRPSRGSP